MINIRDKFFVIHDLFDSISHLSFIENLFQPTHFRLFSNEMYKHHDDLSRITRFINAIDYQLKNEKKNVFVNNFVCAAFFSIKTRKMF